MSLTQITLYIVNLNCDNLVSLSKHNFEKLIVTIIDFHSLDFWNVFSGMIITRKFENRSPACEKAKNNHIETQNLRFLPNVCIHI
jgi:predicted MPP superfamily phosphohydrolase